MKTASMNSKYAQALNRLNFADSLTPDQPHIAGVTKTQLRSFSVQGVRHNFNSHARADGTGTYRIFKLRGARPVHGNRKLPFTFVNN